MKMDQDNEKENLNSKRSWKWKDFHLKRWNWKQKRIWRPVIQQQTTEGWVMIIILSNYWNWSWWSLTVTFFTDKNSGILLKQQSIATHHSTMLTNLTTSESNFAVKQRILSLDWKSRVPTIKSLLNFSKKDMARSNWWSMHTTLKFVTCLQYQHITRSYGAHMIRLKVTYDHFKHLVKISRITSWFH